MFVLLALALAQDPEVERFDALIRKLQACRDEEERGRLLEQADEFVLSPELAVRRLRAAAEAYPDDDEPYGSTREELITKLWEARLPGLLPVVEEHWKRFAAPAGVREAALRLLTEINSRDARALLVRLVKTPEGRKAELDLALEPWKELDHDLTLRVVPTLLELVPHLEQPSAVDHFMLLQAEGGVFDPNAAPIYVRHRVAKAKELIRSGRADFDRHAAVFDRREPEPEESDDAFEALRGRFIELEILLDLLGHVRIVPVEDVLRSALTLASFKLRAFALAALVHRELAVDAVHFDACAADPGGRATLWEALETAGGQARFPEKYRTQALLAEAALVDWLQHPNELGHSPAEILPLARAEFKEEGALRRLYAFRYRHPDHDDGAWLVGVAGPYDPSQPAQLWGPGTFSHFTPLDEKPLEEHFRDYVDEEIPFKVLKDF